MQDPAIVESNGAQPIVKGRGDASGVARDLLDVLEHHAILIRDRRRPMIGFQRVDQRFIQRDPTQKLCVRLQSILAPVDRRHHRRDHLVLATAQRQLG